MKPKSDLVNAASHLPFECSSRMKACCAWTSRNFADVVYKTEFAPGRPSTYCSCHTSVLERVANKISAGAWNMCILERLAHLVMAHPSLFLVYLLPENHLDGKST